MTWLIATPDGPSRGDPMVDYRTYQHLIVEKKDGIALITMNRPEVYNATNGRLHYELGRIWLDIGEDAEISVAVITGAGRAVLAGGDLDMIESFFAQSPVLVSTNKEDNDLLF